jgi:hypothetical protein
MTVIIIGILLLIITALLLVIFYYSKFAKIKKYLKIILESINNNLYLYLLPFPIIYLLFYGFYYLPNIEALKNSKQPIPFFCREEVVDFLKGISIIFFSGGIFSATVKLINNLVVFKNNFQKVILSDDFDVLLKDKFQILALSDDFLLKRTDIQDIWSRVTTCQFEQAFPELKNSIVKKLENDFFNDKMLTYYYNNFRIQINLELLDENIVKITEVSNFEVKAKTTAPIYIDFKITSLAKDDGTIYTKLIEEDCKLDGNKMILSEITSTNDNKNIKTFNTELSRNTSYILERKVEMTQNLIDDRVFSFSSSIIIDNMTVNINPCDKLNIYFSVVGKNKFSNDNHLGDKNTRICRDVLLPGEKFKIFIYKNT